jgi:hypothetical protein
MLFYQYCQIKSSYLQNFRFVAAKFSHRAAPPAVFPPNSDFFFPVCRKPLGKDLISSTKYDIFDLISGSMAFIRIPFLLPF